MKNKVVIVTGGTRGIGLGIAKEFLNLGCKVAMNYSSDDQNAENVISSLDSKNVICAKADITVKKDRDKLFDQVLDQFGGFDILVNNAGIIRLGRLLDITEEDFNTVMQCNLHAPIFLAQAFAKALVDQKKPGSIINILSVGAYGAGNLAYCTSKAALLLATKCMARELAKHNIRANSVSPSGVATNLNRSAWENNPETWKKMLNKVPMKRAATPEEIAGAVVYLASDAASYTTGIDIPVDGGILTTQKH